jgi:hypothetical protein
MEEFDLVLACQQCIPKLATTTTKELEMSNLNVEPQRLKNLSNPTTVANRIILV